MAGGKVSVYLRGDVASPIWQARLRVNGRYVRQSLGTEDRDVADRLAKDLAIEVKTKMASGIAVVSKRFNEVAEEYLTHQQNRFLKKEISGASVTLAKSFLMSWVRYLGTVEIAGLSDTLVAEYAPWRLENNRNGENMRPASLQAEYAAFKSLIKFAIDKKYLNASQIPAYPTIRITRENRTTRSGFSASEMTLIGRELRVWADNSNDKEEIYRLKMVAAYFWFLCYSGLRTGSETKNLRWNDIKYGKYVRIHITDGEHGRDISVTKPQIRSVLLEWRKVCRGRTKWNLIFDLHTAKGNVKRKYVRLFNEVLNKLGLKKDRQGVNRTFYSCRLSYVTQCTLCGGVDAYRLAKNA